MNDSVSTEERLKALSKEKASLLERLLEKRSRQKQQIKPYPRPSGTERVQMQASSGQQRLWFIDKLEGSNAAYNIAFAIRLRGRLDHSPLQAALDDLVKRHESLRTTFAEVDGEPVQEIAREARFELHCTDLGAKPRDQHDAEVRFHSRQEFNAAFDLSKGPLIRGRLLQLSPDEHVLLIAMHHIISDGWSMSILLKELGELYSAHRDGRPDPLPKLPIQYGDYVQWQSQWLKTELHDRLRYWTKHLQGAPELLELPTDRSRPKTQSHRGAKLDFLVDQALTTDLKALSRRLSATLAMTLYAGWAVVLSRLSGQEDVVIGMPIANRQRTEIEGVIGLFINTLALRVRLDDDPVVTDLVSRVKELLLEAYAHQEVPFEKVVEALRPARRMSYSPIFQVMFALQNAPANSMEVPGLTLEPLDIPLETAQFDLSVSLHESAEGILATFNYATDLFDAGTVERWAKYFKCVLSEMVRQPQTTVSRLQLIDEDERHQLIELFSATQAPYPQEKLIHQLFEEQVERTPSEIAVICGDQHWTYGELNSRANQLARFLQSQGAGPECLVGLCVERGFDMIVGLLGILKAGAAYVPLDSNYPKDRLEYMIRDAAPVTVLTHERLKNCLPGHVGVVRLDTQWPEIARQRRTNLGLEVLSSSAIAYVIYTSGSTGQPKGVAIEHRNAINLICWAQSALPPDVFSRTLQSTSLNFDLSVYECFVPLTVGGSIHVVENALALTREPADTTLINTVPSAIKALVDAGGIPKTTRVVNLAGEALKQDLVERIFASSTVEYVCNLYGPSETTTYSTWVSMPRESGFNATIGRPIANTEIYILDGHGHVVPIGVIGEIYIGGAGVARGYLNRPKLTAERFIRDPFSTDPNARMYKTGDLGRWRVDGTIEYLGRNDHQVKIRGFRIELGEIEAQLTRHEQVKEAAVIAREDVPGEKRLVAYLVTSDPANEPSVESLRSHLKATLPEYMVPSAFVMLERMPLTPNGKLDRRALPAPELDAYGSRQYEAPQGEVEEILAGIWQELLRVERVGRTDNFFELGGHSLTAMKLMVRIEEVLRVRIPVVAVFKFSTITSLAELVESLCWTSAEPCIEGEPEFEEGVILPDTAHSGATDSFATMEER